MAENNENPTAKILGAKPFIMTDAKGMNLKCLSAIYLGCPLNYVKYLPWA